MFNKLFPLFLRLSAKVEQDFQDKQITVDELLGLIKTVIDELGLGDEIILDMTKKT